MRLQSLLTASWLLVSCLIVPPAAALPQQLPTSDYPDTAEPQPGQLHPGDIDSSTTGRKDVGRPDVYQGRLLAVGTLVATTLAASNAGLAIWMVKQNGKRVAEIRGLRDDLKKQVKAAEAREGLLQRSLDAHGKELAEVRQQLTALHQRLGSTERELERALVREAQVLAATGAQKSVEGIGGPIEQQPAVLECVADKLEKIFQSRALHEDGVNIAHRTLNALIADCGRQHHRQRSVDADWLLPETEGARTKVRVVYKKRPDGAAAGTGNGGQHRPNSNTHYQRGGADDVRASLLAGLSAENVRRHFAPAQRVAKQEPPLVPTSGISAWGVGGGGGVSRFLFSRIGVR